MPLETVLMVHVVKVNTDKLAHRLVLLPVQTLVHNPVVMINIIKLVAGLVLDLVVMTDTIKIVVGLVLDPVAMINIIKIAAGLVLVLVVMIDIIKIAAEPVREVVHMIKMPILVQIQQLLIFFVNIIQRIILMGLKET